MGIAQSTRPLTCASVLQSLLTGQQTREDMLSVLNEVSKTKSMALLLRTLVAAYVQKELHHSGCRDEGYVLPPSAPTPVTHISPCVDSNTGYWIAQSSKQL